MVHGDLILAGRYGRYRNSSSRYSGHYTVATAATGPSRVGSGEATAKKQLGLCVG